MKTVKMIFGEDKFLNGELFANKGKAIGIASESVERWMKRGGVIVGEEIAKVDASEIEETPAKVEPPKEEEIVHEKPAKKGHFSGKKK